MPKEGPEIKKLKETQTSDKKEDLFSRFAQTNITPDIIAKAGDAVTTVEREILLLLCSGKNFFQIVENYFPNSEPDTVRKAANRAIKKLSEKFPNIVKDIPPAWEKKSSISEESIQSSKQAIDQYINLENLKKNKKFEIPDGIVGQASPLYRTAISLMEIKEAYEANLGTPQYFAVLLLMLDKKSFEEIYSQLKLPISQRTMVVTLYNAAFTKILKQRQKSGEM